MPISPAPSDVARWEVEWLEPFEKAHGPLPPALVDFLMSTEDDEQHSFTREQPVVIHLIQHFLLSTGAPSAPGVSADTPEQWWTRIYSCCAYLLTCCLPASLLACLLACLLTSFLACLPACMCFMFSHTHTHTGTEQPGVTQLTILLLYIKQLAAASTAAGRRSFWSDWLKLLPPLWSATAPVGVWTRRDLAQLQLEPLRVRVGQKLAQKTWLACTGNMLLL